MKLLVQRVFNASVLVEEKEVGKIDRGLLIFLGISRDCNEEKIKKAVKKILNLRLWASEKKGFDLNIKDINGSLLIVSQFTLFANCRKGNKPDFSMAMKSENAKFYYEKFIELSREEGINVQTGKFGAMMDVSIRNDGPVTIILEF